MWVTIFRKRDLTQEYEEKLVEALDLCNQTDETFKYIENPREYRIYSRTQDNALSRGKWLLERIGVLKDGRRVREDIDYTVAFVEGVLEEKADLHVRTTASDGIFRPAEAATLADENDLSAIAIVDHDTVAGIEPAIEAARPHDVEVIPAVELCHERDGQGIHIIGYFVDWENQALNEILKQFQDTRRLRMMRILEKLERESIDVPASQVLRECGEGSVISRLHIARVMVKLGYVRSTNEAFEEYLDYGAPAYVKKFQLSLEEILKLIRDAGGVPALAHPKFSQAEEILPDLVDTGLEAIEVKHPTHDKQDVNRFRKLAREYDLTEVGGTDWKDIDQEVGDITVTMEAVEDLKKKIIKME